MNSCEPNSTPKLSLSKLPCKPREPIQMLTPPIHPIVSIPFRWEEAPGKPRAAPCAAAQPHSCAGEPPESARTKVARCLDLPPRLLLDDTRIMVMPSPETVLDGPYMGRSLSLACTFSFRKGMVVAGRDDGSRLGFVGKDEKFGSARWGSFREEERLRKGNFDNSHTLGEMFESEKKVRMTRVKRRRSFFNLATINSNVLDICASFKQVVPWRRRR